MLSGTKHPSLTTIVMLSTAKHPSLINIAETLRQAQGDNTPYPPGCRIKPGVTKVKKQVRSDSI